MPKFKIELNKEECIGCGACAAQCPANWELNETEGKASPKKSEVDDLGCNREAEDVCPVNAIKIKEL